MGVSELTIGLLGALLATNQPLAVSNLVQQQTGVSVSILNPNDPAEQDLRKLMEDDDAALAEVDVWIRTNNTLMATGAGESKEALNLRIHARLDTVRTNYAAFLRRHPDSSRGYLAYGSFLDDIGDEDAGKVQFGNAAQADPKNPAAWNNLANYYGENGGLTNAFTDYARAIELDPTEPVYYQNLATTVYLYRKDARAFTASTNSRSSTRRWRCIRRPSSSIRTFLTLATDYAETYYGIKPLRTNDALVAWTKALNVARTDVEREGVFIHLARLKFAAGFFNEARAQLAAVTNDFYADLKKQSERNLVERENPPTNVVQEATTKTSGQQLKVFGDDFTSMYSVTKNGNGLSISGDIPDEYGKLHKGKGMLWTTPNQDPFSGKRTAETKADGLTWTPRVLKVGKLDLTTTGKLTELIDFDWKTFKEADGVIPFANGYGVNIFVGEVNQGVMSSVIGNYLTDNGKILLGRLIKETNWEAKQLLRKSFLTPRPTRRRCGWWTDAPVSFNFVPRRLCGDILAHELLRPVEI